MTDSLVAQAHEARRRCREAGDPEPMAHQIEALIAQAERLRGQGDQLSRAFAVLDRLVPPEPAAARRRATGPGARGRGPGRGAERALPPQAETRAAAFAFARALRLEGASPEYVEAKLIDEFGRADAQQIVDQVFGAGWETGP